MSVLITTEADSDDASLWWVFLLTGILWIVFAWIVLSFNYSTVWAVAVFFGFGLIGGGLMELMVGWQARAWRWLHFTFGVLCIVGGIVALVWPGETFLVLAAIIGWFVLFAGIVDLVTAIATREVNDLWWLGLILGIVEILIGFWAVGYSGRSIALLVVWVGAVALARGISNLFVAFGLHRIGKQVRQRMVPAG
jgi:uncharacterized membrane protein HdeD (DUF308 family)